MKIRFLFATILVALIALTACEDEGQKSSDSKLSLSFQAVESTSLLKATDTLVFDSAMVGIKEIEIEREEADDDSLEGDDGDEVEYEFEGPYQINLLAGTKIPELARVEPGIYNELEAELAPVLENNHSVYIEARYTNATGETHPVIFYTDEEIDFEIESDQGIQVNDQDIIDLIVRINLSDLFSIIDLDAAAIDESGRILINEEQNASMAEKLEEYLEETAEMEEDDDEDHDDDEDDDNGDDDDDDNDD